MLLCKKIAKVLSGRATRRQIVREDFHLENPHVFVFAGVLAGDETERGRTDLEVTNCE